MLGSVITRRALMRRAGLALATGSASGMHVRASIGQGATDRSSLIVRSRRPEDLETPVAAFTDWITRNEIFFVRSHLYTPTIDLRQWTLTIGGAVDRPLSLQLDEIRSLPRVTMPVTLECAGNGRAYFNPPVAGVQWRKGAVGTARWTGVRLADVLARAGVKAAARFVFMDGADVPVGAVPDFQRTLPIAKAMDRDTLLAFDMNGVPLPMSHGSPLRAIVPGWEGAYSVKWLTGIRLLEQQHDGFFVQTAYRYPARPVSPGATVPADAMEPLTGLTVKSMIVTPRDGSRIAMGRTRIAGFAWAGESEVTRVDISVDGGQSWQPARLGSDRATYAWRAFEYDWNVGRPGAYEVMARATDMRGRTQSGSSPWNPSGYLWNAVDRVSVSTEATNQRVAAGAAEATALPQDEAATLAQQKCVTCHGSDLIVQQRLDEAGWSREVDKMIRWGAAVSDVERRRLIEYFVRHFAPR